jgi:aspartate/methionine/tyrosine aminotransferase
VRVDEVRLRPFGPDCGRPVLFASKLRASAKASSFTESVIREMTRLADLHGAINLGQGFPDFPAAKEVKDAAARAIEEDHNQ